MRPTTVEKCSSCPYKRAKTCASFGPSTARLIVVGEAPGKEELKANRPFVGKPGQLLRAALAKAGIDPEEAYFTNSLRCLPEQNAQGSFTPSKTAINACQERLSEEILAYPRDVVLLLGNSAARSFFNDHNFKITSRRGQPVVLDSEGLYDEDALQEYRRSKYLGQEQTKGGLSEGSNSSSGETTGLSSSQSRQGSGVRAQEERLPNLGAGVAGPVQKSEEAVRNLPNRPAGRKGLGNRSRSQDRQDQGHSVPKLQQRPRQAQGQSEASTGSLSLPDTVVLPTFHPASILRNQGEYPRWIEDIMYAGRLLNGGTEAIKRPPKPTAHIILAEPDEAAYYPVIMELNETTGRVLQTDFDTTREWDDEIVDGSQQFDWPKREVLSGIPMAVRAVNFLLKQPELSGDIETGYSYSPRYGQVLALSVAWSPTEAIVFSEGLIKSKGFRPHLQRLLTDPSPMWIGHNFKYDGAYLRHQIFGGEWPETGALSDPDGPNPYYDTMLAHYTLDETKGTHDLESVARDLLGAEDYKKVVKKYTRGTNAKKGIEADKGYENVPREILYPYCALDTTHTFSIHQLLYPKIKASKSMTRMYEGLLLPASRFLQRVQDVGLWVDQEFVDSLDKEFTDIIEARRAVLMKEVNDKIFDLYPLGRTFAENEELGPTDRGPLWDVDIYMQSEWATKKQPDDDAYNPGAFRHTAFVLYRLIGWVPMNTNERTLRDLDQTGKDQSATFGYKAKNYARGHPNRKQKLKYDFIQSLIDVRLASHSYSMLVRGIRKNMEPDGRLHTSFNLQATETGRLSSTGPNLQNLPVPEPDDERPARNIVGAPPGRVLIEADYSQVELRLLAHFSNDANLIQVYKDERDLHTELSIAIWGDVVLDEQGKQIGGYTKYQRVRAKAVNFGIAYGRGAGSIAAEHDIPEAEAEEMRQAWFAQFPSAAKWLEQLHQAPFQGQTVVTVFGRRRRFGVVSRDNYHDLKNQSANFPMQSTASDLTLLSGMRIQRKWNKSGLDAKVICLVHDALVVEASEVDASQAREELKAMMADIPRRVLNSVIDFPVDVHTGRSWGTLKSKEMAVVGKAGNKVETFGKAGRASGKL